MTGYICLILIILILIAALVYVCVKYAKPKTEPLQVQSKPVQFGLKNIGELATQSGFFTNVQMIEDAQHVWHFQLPFTRSRYIFSYDGVIRAGINFEDISWQVDDEQCVITVKLPRVQIFSCEVDENSLKVYDEIKNIFTPLDLNKVNMSLIKMKEEARQAAIANGLIENARSNAELLIRGYLAAYFDMETYKVEFR